MQKLLAKTLIGSSLLLAGINSVDAQYYPDSDRRTYRDTYRNDSGDYRGAFYNRLEFDLARAAKNGYLTGGDLRRFRQASDEIREFQEKWARGRYDRHELDDAIGATQRVANLRGLDYRDRAAINEDLARMRDFRARMNGDRGYGNDSYYRRR
jgi:hypothetical protein